MFTTYSNELYRISAAATDAGFLDWLRVIVMSGVLAALIRVVIARLTRSTRRLGLRAAQLALLLLVVMPRPAHAQVPAPAPAELSDPASSEGMSDDEVQRRVHWIEAHLKTEQRQAQWYEAGWSLVYVGGVGYGAYQIATANTRAATAEGIVGASKSLIGAASLALVPIKTARSLSDLDRGAPSLVSHARDQRLAVAESILLRNAEESDIRYKWQPHIVSLLLNLAGGAIVWACGDWQKALQSTAIAIPVGELSIWTRPWKAKKDLREYKREFGGLAYNGRPRSTNLASAPHIGVSASGLQLTF
jgi:hypothetical protein